MTSTITNTMLPYQIITTIQLMAKIGETCLKLVPNASPSEQMNLLEPTFRGIEQFMAAHRQCKAALAEAECKPREYTTPYGHKFSKLSELALAVANSLEDNQGQTYKLVEVVEHKSLCKLLDLLVDADILPLKSVRKLDGLSLSQLESFFLKRNETHINITAPETTISSPIISMSGTTLRAFK